MVTWNFLMLFKYIKSYEYCIVRVLLLKADCLIYYQYFNGHFLNFTLILPFILSNHNFSIIRLT